MDGSHMADYLVKIGYEVFGLVRRQSTSGTERIQHLLKPKQIELLKGDITDLSSLKSALIETLPDEVYNFAAQSHVGVSFKEPLHTLDVNGKGALNLFEVVRHHARDARIYQASSSEMFGGTASYPRSGMDENTPLLAVSPYGVSKCVAHLYAQMYRRAYGMFIACGIAFNHESERRGEDFVTRKIVRTVAKIAQGEETTLELGNLNACRDWGYAPEYIPAMQKMLRRDKPEDFVLATGEAHSVREFLELAFELAGIKDGLQYVKIVETETRPKDVPCLLGNAAKARDLLNFKPHITFEELVRKMLSVELGYEPART